MYQPRRASRSDFLAIRNQRYHVRTWGEPSPERPVMVMVHGWMDVSASWQFVVDAMAQDRFIVAPDWRGFGLTEGPPVDHYWFPDYLADLDLLLDHYSPDAPVHLVGHSMGGGASMLYCGARPHRVARLVNLEGFGMPATQPSQAPRRYAQWMDQMKTLRRGEMGLRPYDSVDHVAQRLMKTNTRLPLDKAQWLAQHWAYADAQGRWHLRGDAAHKIINAQLYRVEEALACYERITAPLLWVDASDAAQLSQWWKERYNMDQARARLDHVADLTKLRLEDAGHMLHHDQPARVAHMIETFFAK
jgi:pimeloyl-ACP methyl ester carboxylesterase